MKSCFVELEQCRLKAPADAHCSRPVSPQLDPVRVFARFASHPLLPIQPSATSMQALPDSVRKQRAPLWQNLEQSLPASSVVAWRAIWFANISSMMS